MVTAFPGGFWPRQHTSRLEQSCRWSCCFYCKALVCLKTKRLFLEWLSEGSTRSRRAWRVILNSRESCDISITSNHVLEKFVWQAKFHCPFLGDDSLEPARFDCGNQAVAQLDAFKSVCWRNRIGYCHSLTVPSNCLRPVRFLPCGLVEKVCHYLSPAISIVETEGVSSLTVCLTPHFTPAFFIYSLIDINSEIHKLLCRIYHNGKKWREIILQL